MLKELLAGGELALVICQAERPTGLAPPREAGPRKCPGSTTVRLSSILLLPADTRFVLNGRGDTRLFRTFVPWHPGSPPLPASMLAH